MNSLKSVHLKKPISKSKINIYNLDIHKLCSFICLTNIISWFTFLMSPSYLLLVFSPLHPSVLIVIIGVNPGSRMASQVVLVVKNLPGNAGDTRDTGSIPGSGRSPGEGHGNPSSLSWRIPWTEEPHMVHGAAKSWTWLNDWNTHNQGSTLSLFTFSPLQSYTSLNGPISYGQLSNPCYRSLTSLLSSESKLYLLHTSAMLFIQASHIYSILIQDQLCFRT